MVRGGDYSQCDKDEKDGEVGSHGHLEVVEIVGDVSHHHGEKDRKEVH